MSGTVHVLPGDSAASGFAESGVAPGEGSFTVRDSLSCGPLVPITDVPSWERGRAAYWASFGEAWDESVIDDPAVLAAAERIVLWLGTQLSEQIALAWLPAFLRALDVDPDRLEVVQFHRDGRGREIPALGMLSPKLVAEHPPSERLSAADLAELDRAWRALTAPDPELLAEYLGAPPPRLPLLHRALRSVPSRYPDVASGVNTKELRLLRHVRTLGPRAVMVLAHVIAESSEAFGADSDGMDLVGDVWLFERMLWLGDQALREPALEITGSRDTYRDCRVRLTSFGERVLDGRASFVEANGIDDWVAGVHLDSAAGRVWFQRDGELVFRQRLA
jgi:hypothetical protein